MCANLGENMLTKEILSSIDEIKEKLKECNDGVKATEKVAQAVIASVQTSFQKFSETKSVDERMNMLAECCQANVQIVEDFHNNLEKEVADFNLQIQTLETLLDKVKKFEEDAGQQNVSIEDDGEKKGDGE